MGTSFLAFGTLSLIDDKHLFITGMFIARFVQGLSSCMIQTTMYSICTNLFENDKEAIIGYIEAFTGIGTILGPLLGTVLYSIGGYEFIFYSFGSIFAIMSIFVMCLFDAKVDMQINNVEIEIKEEPTILKAAGFIEDDSFFNAESYRDSPALS
jgi:MFS family permease